MKLEVGMYVRTDTGIIEKLEGIHKQNETKNTIIKLNKMGGGKYAHIVDFNSEFEKEFDKDFSRGNVIKASHNIIDLIQVGDYVNGLKVYEVRNDIKGFGIVVFSDCSIHEWQINSIVTKEQFESMSYKVGE